MRATDGWVREPSPGSVPVPGSGAAGLWVHGENQVSSLSHHNTRARSDPMQAGLSEARHIGRLVRSADLQIGGSDLVVGATSCRSGVLRRSQRPTLAPVRRTPILSLLLIISKVDKMA